MCIRDSYYIRKDGTVHLTRPVERIGAHVKGFNANSIGICYEGGLDLSLIHICIWTG